MNLIDEINKEIRELDREIKSLTLETLDDESETPKPPKRKRGRPAIVENKIFVEMWNAALENGSLESISSRN